MENFLKYSKVFENTQKSGKFQNYPEKQGNSIWIGNLWTFLIFHLNNNFFFSEAGSNSTCFYYYSHSLFTLNKTTKQLLLLNKSNHSKFKSSITFRCILHKILFWVGLVVHYLKNYNCAFDFELGIKLYKIGTYLVHFYIYRGQARLLFFGDHFYEK